MKRVVITGAGIVSCLGNTRDDVVAALRDGRSGIRAMPEFAEMGLRSQVGGALDIDLDARIDRKQRRRNPAPFAAYLGFAPSGLWIGVQKGPR